MSLSSFFVRTDHEENRMGILYNAMAHTVNISMDELD